MANSVDPDQTQVATSDQGLHCLQLDKEFSLMNDNNDEQSRYPLN